MCFISAGEEEGGRKATEEEIFYAVPHERSEVDEIVASAVGVFWNRRRCGEPLDRVDPDDSFFDDDDANDGNDDSLESRSRRVFKRLLFHLTGEVIEDIYRDEADSELPLPPWQKPSPKRQRYYRGARPPTTRDVLEPAVQGAVARLLATHSRARPPNKWNVRKRKDHVDSVLVEELRQEEAGWVDYARDELLIKMQLTDTIFDSLLGDTVTTVNGIYRRRRQQQAQSAL